MAEPASLAPAGPITSFWSMTVGGGIPQPVDNAGLFNVVGAHFHFHSVTDGNHYEVLSELAGNMSQHLVAIGKLYPEHSPGQDCDDLALDFYNVIVIRHQELKSSPCKEIPQPCQVPPLRKCSREGSGFMEYDMVFLPG